MREAGPGQFDSFCQLCARISRAAGKGCPDHVMLSAAGHGTRASVEEGGAFRGAFGKGFNG